MARRQSAYQAFHYAETSIPLPALVPYTRCTCGACRNCREDAKWDRIFAKFETKNREERGVFQCALKDL